ncbi:hypothetical protein AMECASPLE_036788 [Ameca splendens]|uniref:Uncharacterized protein n=1 Tax=Ameca splendens TaxID=208324 RepID=A0ABV0YUX4_9TELE
MVVPHRHRGDTAGTWQTALIAKASRSVLRLGILCQTHAAAGPEFYIHDVVKSDRNPPTFGRSFGESGLSHSGCPKIHEALGAPLNLQILLAWSQLNHSLELYWSPLTAAALNKKKTVEEEQDDEDRTEMFLNFSPSK